MNYAEARAHAQRRANETGLDHGVEPVGKPFPGTYMVYMLPQRQNRYGHERRCEVVSCERLSDCRPGHGPIG
jgi:hypothetical protein